MPIIDFREIPEAQIATGKQDTFELFARDFFVDILKFKIISEPNRGADGGKDILCEEEQSGTLSENKVRWLVSCKHKAHSGRSVTPDDETNITDRVKQFNANGFIGFYSTLPSSGLNERLDALKKDCRVEIFDRGKIEDFILSHRQYELLRRYFPNSYKNWYRIKGIHEPSRILDKYYPLECKVCGCDLLKKACEDESNQNRGNIAFVLDPDTQKIIDVYATCAGSCDRKMQSILASKGLYTAWDSINDLLIPTLYLRRLMALINQFAHDRSEFELPALEKYKNILIAISQYVFRQQSDNELERAKDLAELPDGL